MYVRNVRAIRGRNKACTTASRIADVLTGWAPAAFETVAFAGSVVADAAIGAIDVTFVARHAHHVDLCGQQHIRHIAHENDSEADLSLTSRVLRETLAVFFVSGRVRVISTGTMAYKVITQRKSSKPHADRDSFSREQHKNVRKEQSGPKYSGNCRSPLLKPTGHEDSHTQARMVRKSHALVFIAAALPYVKSTRWTRSIF